MSPPELLDALAALAREVDLEVRVATGRDDATSAVCRLRDRIWVMLSASDPVERRIEVLAGALRDHAASACEERWLPPAVRAVLER